jgi:23S rRNA pseudouridine2605 synthase
MRLNKFLSSCGLGSRRGVEALILEGRVRINGKVCTELGTQVESTDEVVVDTRKVRPNKPVVIALHKPKGYVCTRDDEHARHTIYDLLPAKLRSLAHVGRLDMDSEGLLLLTNQGDLSHQLAHPTHGLEKEYEVQLEKPFDPALLEKLTHGLRIEEGFAKAERAWIIGHYKLGLVLKQGLKRQIRHMLFYVGGYEVKRLVRVRIGNLPLTGIPEGGWRELKPDEVDRLLVHPKAKERPTLSKSRTASARKAMTERVEKEKELERKTKAAEAAGKAPSSRSPRKRPARKTSRRGGARGGY